MCPSTKLSDEDNPDDWDGRDWAEELMDAELSLKPRHAQGEYPPLSGIEVLIPADVDESGYSAGWPAISARIRAACGYRCQKCNANLDSRRDLLHVHHLDFHKDNNEKQNLLAVCVLCHSEFPNHAHLAINLNVQDREHIERSRPKR